MNAEYSVTRDGLHTSLVLKSAGGRAGGSESSRHHQYVPALRLLLGRLRELKAVLLSAVVVSSRVAALPESDRTLLSGPLDLAAVADIEQLRLDITRAQGRVGLPEGTTKEGNNRKRIQLRLAVPGYGPDDAGRLAEDLAKPRPAHGSEPFTTNDLLDDAGNLRLHSQDGRMSLHKPLTLLWMMGRMATGGVRLVPWPEFRQEVGTFLEEFAPAGSRVTPQYPFWHLSSSRRLWEVHGVTDVPTAADTTAVAGLTHEAADLLRDGAVRAKVIDLLMSQYLADVVDEQALGEWLTRAQARGNAPRARDVLRPLISEEIPTVTGRPNTVRAMSETIELNGGWPPVPEPDLHVDPHGAGFSVDPQRRLEIEQAAMQRARLWYEQRGYTVTDVSAARCGWDLTVESAGAGTRHVEVKGVSGAVPTILLTRNEYNNAVVDPAWELFVVTEALTPNPRIHQYTAKEAIDRAESMTYQLVLPDNGR